LPEKFHGMKSEIPAIVKSGGGAIVNNASLLALKPSARSPIYSASKAAVASLTKSSAVVYLCSAKSGFTI
jgi:short-subunit dehydrogenase